MPEWAVIGQMVATTTLETIRENMETLIHALVPSRHAREKFSIERGEIDFRAWAETNKAASFRRYAIERSGNSEPADEASTGLDSQEEQATLQVTVAYPHQWGRYGPQNRQDMDDTIESDAAKIRNALGAPGMGNWVAGQRDAFDTMDTDEGDGITFLLINIDLIYFRSMT